MKTEISNEQSAMSMSAGASVQVVTEIAATTSTTAQKPKLTLAQVRAKLDGQQGKRFWKSLDELADTPDFQELMQEEFPRQAGAGEWIDPVSRRGFLKVMGASFAMAGLAGCTKQPDEPIFAYVKQPEDLVLGRPMFFATAHPFATGAIPVLVKSDAFRPIKLEGNPEHPMSKGKSDALTQATLLDLYDPDRSKEPKYRGDTSSFADFQTALAAGARQSSGGQGIYFLSGTVISPTFAAQWKQVQAKYPQARLVQYEPVGGVDAGATLDTQYKLENADVILSLDADFLSSIAFPGFLPMSAAYAARHRYEETPTLNRLYVVETMPSVTGFKAEHRLALKPSDLDAFAQALASGGSFTSADAPPDAAKFAQAVLADLKAAGSKAVVVAGPQSSPACQAAARALNASIGAVGSTVVYGNSVQTIAPEAGTDIKSLVADMNAGKVQWLVVLNQNPFYTAPVDLEFAQAFTKVPNSAHLGQYWDETGFQSVWHLNAAHYLESWSDARAYDGTISIIQPMIDPLYGGKTAHDVLNVLLDPSQGAYDSVVATAKTYLSASAGDGFTAAWRKALHDGWVEGTAFTAGTAASSTAASGGAASSGAASSKAGAKSAMTAPAPSDGSLEIRFLADTNVYDGRFANNGWLQELPRQVTSIAWDNAALMSLDTMDKLGIEENEPLELTLNGRKITTPVLMVPGHANGSITLHLGYGRTGGDGLRVAAGVGANAYLLRTVDAPLASSGLAAKKGTGTYDLCVTKTHNIEHRGAYAQHDLEHPEFDTQGVYSLAGHEAMERAIIRYATLDEAKKMPNFTEEGTQREFGTDHTLTNKVGYNPEGEKIRPDETLFRQEPYNEWRYNKTDPSTLKIQNAWGMAIDLNSCTGCNTCIVACYAENNIPVVGREQVKIGRDMQWLRIDTYFEGDLHAPRAHFQPMTCQHCESAGCEQVCPVGATVHTPEGINTMVYNRCVGTRYCSNNCPYKVRRFNFLLYSDYETESLKLMRNPDVSVRSRGVMEKCSYCIQRIDAVKIDADKNNRAIVDGEILTACQQACPTEAIVFGNLNDPASKVAKRKRSERDYHVLEDLNYRPRTSYTAGVINPNAELA
jgi:MoCo/4Fe-4S cofactor protein with predicted Tat translocation signal